MASGRKAGNRRTGPRLILEPGTIAILRVGTLGTHVQSRIVDASERGLRLTLPEPRPVGTHIRIRVQIQDPVYEISVAGLIVHLKTEEVEGGPDQVQAGILLTEVGPDWRALLRRIK